MRLKGYPVSPGVCLIPYLDTHSCIGQFEEHGVDNVEPSELIQGGRREDDLTALFQVCSLVTRKHGDGVALVLRLEGTGGLPEEVHAVHGYGYGYGCTLTIFRRAPVSGKKTNTS